MALSVIMPTPEPIPFSFVEIEKRVAGHIHIAGWYAHSTTITAEAVSVIEYERAFGEAIEAWSDDIRVVKSLYSVETLVIREDIDHIWLLRGLRADS